MGRGKEGRKGTGVCPGGPSLGELRFFAVCKNQRFDRSGVEMASVPAELCGTALNWNPNHLKRLLWFWGPGSAFLKREVDVFSDANFYILLLVVVPRAV